MAEYTIEEIEELVQTHMFDQADPGGKPKHGRKYGTLDEMTSPKGPKWSTSLSEIDPSLLDIIWKSKLTDETKANLFVKLAVSMDMYKKGIKEEFIDITGFIRSLTTVNIKDAYPVWCYPDYVPIVNTREEVEKHYIARQTALMNLGRASDGTHQLYRFLENYPNYFHINNECLCNFVVNSVDHRKGGKINLNIEREFGKGKVGTATLINDQKGHSYIMKTIKTRVNGSQISVGNAAPNNPIAEAIKFDGNKFIAIGNDDFTNQTIMHMILNLLLGHSPNYVYQYDAFICDGLGVNIMDIASEGDMYSYLKKIAAREDLSPMKKSRLLLDSCADCFEQLLPLLSYLKQPGIGFIHNDFKVKNVFVNVKDGKTLYLLADFDKSQITWKNLRFYNNNYDPSAVIDPASNVVYNGLNYHQLNPGKLGAVASTIGSLFGKGINSEVLGKSMATYTMFNSNGYYLCYDIYTLLLSMLFVDEVYSAYRAVETSRFHNIVKNIIMPFSDRKSHPNGMVFDEMLKHNMRPEGGKIKRSEEDLQRVTIINGILHKGVTIGKKSYFLEMKNDIALIMAPLRLTSFDPGADDISKTFYEIAMDKSLVPVVSVNGYVCLEKPKAGKCRTTQYRSKLGRIYTEDDVIDKYQLELPKIFAPLQGKDSYNACKTLLSYYDAIKNKKRLRTTIHKVESTGYLDIFSTYRTTDFDEDKLKTTGIMQSDLYTVYKTIITMIFRAHPLFERSIFCEFTPEDPFILVSNTTYDMDKMIATAQTSISPERKDAFQRCYAEQDYIIGFINLYKKSRVVMDHKNTIIIDKLHGKIIRFEPKAPSMLGSLSATVRHDISEAQVKSSIKGRYDVDLDSFDYMVVYGNQSNIPYPFQDAIFCTVYSLYAAILWTINYYKFSHHPLVNDGGAAAPHRK